MLSLFFELIICFSIFFFIYFQKKYKILLDNKNKTEHKFLFRENIPLSGGIFFYFVFLASNIKHGNFIIFFFSLTLILILKIFSDLKNDLNSSLRLFLQFLIILFSIVTFNFFINDYWFNILNILNKFYLIKIFLSLLCILVFLNGVNFLDGKDGLVPGYFILIFSSLSYVFFFEEEKLFYENKIYLILISLTIFYFLNIKGRVMLGDSGSSILSIYTSFLLIFLSNTIEFINPIYIFSILLLPSFELLFSIIRRIKNKVSPFSADNRHIHDLIYIFYEEHKLKKKWLNFITGTSINFVLIPFFLIFSLFYNNEKILLITCLMLIMLYIFVYKYLNSKYKKINLKN